jgi:hypothetical protein
MIAIIAFVVGMGWKSIWGPEKVIILRDESPKSIDTTVNVYKLEGDSATLDALRNYNSKVTIESDDDPKNNTAELTRPKFRLPDIVEGYRLTGINSFASAEVYRNTYTSNEFIEVYIKFFSKETLKRITPIFIEVYQEKEKNSISVNWAEQFTAVHQNNLIKFSSDFSKGEYRLAIGFYLMDELNQEFPTKYVKRFNIRIL